MELKRPIRTRLMRRTWMTKLVGRTVKITSVKSVVCRMSALVVLDGGIQWKVFQTLYLFFYDIIKNCICKNSIQPELFSCCSFQYLLLPCVYNWILDSFSQILVSFVFTLFLHFYSRNFCCLISIIIVMTRSQLTCYRSFHSKLLVHTSFETFLGFRSSSVCFL